MSHEDDHDINPPSLIAIFPLRGRYPGMAIGILLQSNDQACAAADTFGISTGTPADVKWNSLRHWFDEESRDTASIFDLDAYSDFMDLAPKQEWIYEICMEEEHYKVFQDILKPCTLRECGKFRRLELPGSMERQTESVEVISASRLHRGVSENAGGSAEGSGSLRMQFGSPLATPASETDVSWTNEQRPSKLRGRADAES